MTMHGDNDDDGGDYDYYYIISFVTKHTLVLKCYSPCMEQLILLDVGQ